MERDQIVAELGEFRDWLEAEHVRTQESRIPKILSIVRGPMEAADPQDFVRKLSLDDKRKLAACFFDAFLFSMIYRQMCRLPSNRLPRAPLREAIKGPLDPADEVVGEESVNARNHMYELELASRFMAAGHQIVAFDDVVVEIQGVKISVQCKRLGNLRNFACSFTQAVNQIRKRIPDAAQYGVVAICLDKVIEASSLIYFPESPEALTATTRGLLSPHHRRLEDCLQDTRDTCVLGGMLDLKCFGIVPRNSQPMLSRQSACARRDPRCPESELFRIMIEE
ncbi:MAG: hypothetical protein KJ626_10855 [Verrucomicrobia bacterium]|nr:hypothetical protein [Verrucomicrobiota bacterium]